MRDEFEQQIWAFIRENKLFGPQVPLLAAVSGGADSIALLGVFERLIKKGLFGGPVVCAHINHQLRGADADTDEQFTTKRAAELELKIVTEAVDVRGYADEHRLSIETAAREVRIRSLVQIAGPKYNARSYRTPGE